MTFSQLQIDEVRRTHSHSMQSMAETILAQGETISAATSVAAKLAEAQELISSLETQRNDLSRVNAELQDEVHNLRKSLTSETTKAQGFERAVTELALKLSAAHEKIATLHKLEAESFGDEARRVRDSVPDISRIAVLTESLESAKRLNNKYRKDMADLVAENVSLYNQLLARVIWRRPFAVVTNRVMTKLRATRVQG